MYDFPELTFVSRHGGEPWTELIVKLMLKWPGLHYSTSAFAPKHYPRAIIDYANSRGADKVMYAGYFPMGLSLQRILTELPNVPLKDDGVAVPAGQRPPGPQARRVGGPLEPPRLDPSGPPDPRGQDQRPCPAISPQSRIRFQSPLSPSPEGELMLGPDDRYIVISGDTHAGGSHAQYREFLDDEYKADFDAWRGRSTRTRSRT